MMNKRILIYTDSFFQISETFIHKQIQSISKDYEFILLGYHFKNDHLFDLPHHDRLHVSYYNSKIEKYLLGVLGRIKGRKVYFGIKSNLMLKKFLSSFDGMIHAHYGTSGVAIMPFAKKYQIPLIVSFHGIDASEKLKDKRYSKYLPELFDYASAIIICSPHMIDTLHLKRWTGKVHLIPYGVEIDNADVKIPRNLDHKIKIVHSGRIVNKKGVPDLIRVFYEISKKYNDVILHIVGEGSEKELCISLANSFGLHSKIYFHGAQSHSKVKEILSSCDIFILNSRIGDNGDMEGVPNSILEAMSLGKPVISTYHAGIPTIITNQVNGILIQEKSNDQLYDAIEKLLKNAQLRNDLGRAGRERVFEAYTLNQMSDKLCSLFDHVYKTHNVLGPH